MVQLTITLKNENCHQHKNGYRKDIKMSIKWHLFDIIAISTSVEVGCPNFPDLDAFYKLGQDWYKVKPGGGGSQVSQSDASDFCQSITGSMPKITTQEEFLQIKHFASESIKWNNDKMYCHSENYLAQKYSKAVFKLILVLLLYGM